MLGGMRVKVLARLYSLNIEYCSVEVVDQSLTQPNLTERVLKGQLFINKNKAVAGTRIEFIVQIKLCRSRDHLCFCFWLMLE